MNSATADPRWSVPNDIGALTRNRPRGVAWARETARARVGS